MQNYARGARFLVKGRLTKVKEKLRWEMPPYGRRNLPCGRYVFSLRSHGICFASLSVICLPLVGVIYLCFAQMSLASFLSASLVVICNCCASTSLHIR